MTLKQLKGVVDRLLDEGADPIAEIYDSDHHFLEEISYADIDYETNGKGVYLVFSEEIDGGAASPASASRPTTFSPTSRTWTR